jgi:hypothetical protein
MALERASICEVSDVVASKTGNEVQHLRLDDLDFHKWTDILKEDVGYDPSIDRLFGVVKGDRMAISNGQMWRTIAKTQHRTGASVLDFTLRRSTAPAEVTTAAPARTSPRPDEIAPLDEAVERQPTPPHLSATTVDVTADPIPASLRDRSPSRAGGDPSERARRPEHEQDDPNPLKRNLPCDTSRESLSTYAPVFTNTIDC